jgi:hypothetical protein
MKFTELVVGSCKSSGIATGILSLSALESKIDILNCNLIAVIFGTGLVTNVTTMSITSNELTLKQLK